MPIVHRRFSAPGTSPGTLIDMPVLDPNQIMVEAFSYGGEELIELDAAPLDQALSLIEDGRVTWINIVGTENSSALRHLGTTLGFHALTLEDVQNTGQRPKLEDYEGYSFVIMRLLSVGNGVSFEQVSMFLGSNYVVTIQESEGDPFDGVRDRIRVGTGKIRSVGPDYLLYALTDALVDSLFPLLEQCGDRIENLHQELVDRPSREALGAIYQIKKDLLHIRRAAWPQREVIHALERDESDLIAQETRVFLRDCYDHAIQVMDIVESYRDLVGGLMDIYLSSLSNKTNEIMKVLTIMASIFIPLTFIAGIYGMNFDPGASPWNMPELGWAWGYPAVIGAMVALGLGMFLYFRRKNWL